MVVTCSCFAPQRGHGRRHAAAARSPDGPTGHAGATADLPAQHYPLHRGHLHTAVHDRDHGPGHLGPGCFQEQVLASAEQDQKVTQKASPES